MFFLPNTIKFIMDRPVEKIRVKELKEILLRKPKESEPERINGEGPTCCKVSSIFNPLFYMIKYN